MDIGSWNKTFVNLVCDWDGAECKSEEKNADNLTYLIVHIGILLSAWSKFEFYIPL